MTEQDLLNLKQEITESKDKSTRLEGRKDQLMEQLKTKYGVSTIQQAEKKLKAMDKEIEDLDEQIETMTDGLEEKINEQNTDTED